MKLVGWILSAGFIAPPAPPAVEITVVRNQSPSQLAIQQQQTSASFLTSTNFPFGSVVLADAAPSKADIQLLRQAFSEFYGVERNLDLSMDLLNQVVERWQGQPADEKAGLYRVRADCHMLRGESAEAYQDYNTAVQLLEGPGKLKADPGELPLALLGRARSVQSQNIVKDHALLNQAVSDYERAIKLGSREEWDTDEELLEDGAVRNPFAAWEWGTMLRRTNDWKRASYAHALASNAFEEIGDKARSIISLLDAGIDIAAAGDVKEAKILLGKAIPKAKGVEARDVALLQRVVAKEGEGRMALASLLWDSGEKNEAEKILGDACVRLDQLQADAMQRNAKNSVKPSSDDTKTLYSAAKYSMDDVVNVFDMTCSRFRNEKFLLSLGWPEDLQKKVIKLEKLL